MFICVFLPVVLVAYNLSKNLTYKNTVLVILSLFFYAWGEPVWVVLLIFSALVDYVNGWIIDKYYARPQATAALIASLVINLGLLAVFKYSGFFVENINSIFRTNIPMPAFSLPIGISFYTFQTLSYTIDMYRGRAHVQKSFISFLAYVSMFPQLVAGPIVRYTQVSHELGCRSVTYSDMEYGICRFTAGMCKKVMLANSAGAAAAMLLDTARLTTASSWLGILLYTFQIYFDFSGYSDMAIGLGRMLGFKFGENFDYPYISRSITEFWRRWHISLSSFFRDYVYIPLGGNRYRPWRNILIVWLLTGLWHGASWNFVLWGLFYGLMLLLEKTVLKNLLDRIPTPLRRVYTMFFVIMGWGLFYFTDMNALYVFLKSAFGIGCALYDLTSVSALCTNLWLLLLCAAASTPVPSVVFRHICKKSELFAKIAKPVLVIAGLGACFILLVGQTYNPFLYFRF